MAELTKGERIRTFLEIASKSPSGADGMPNTALAQQFILKALPESNIETQQRYLIDLTSDVAAQITGTSFQTQIKYETLLDKIAGKQNGAATALREVGKQLGL